MVAAVQDALALAAYGPLTVDGVAGPATEEAVKRFQRDHNLAVTGQITEGLIVDVAVADKNVVVVAANQTHDVLPILGFLAEAYAPEG